MFYQKRITSLALLSLAYLNSSYADSSWDSIVSGGWNTAANWEPSGVPNSPTTKVTFPDLGTPLTATQDTGGLVSVGSLIFTSNSSYTISQAANVDLIMFGAISGPLSDLTVVNGSHKLLGFTVSQPFFQTTVPLLIQIQDPLGALTLENGQLVNIVTPVPITVTGPGTLNIINGALFTADVLTFSGAFVNIQTTVSPLVPSLGSYVGQNDVAIIDSTVAFHNIAPISVSNTVGVAAEGQNVSITDSVVSFINSGSQTAGVNQAVGVGFQGNLTSPSITIDGSTLTLLNQGNIIAGSTRSFGVGAISVDEMTLNSGIITLNNTATVADGGSATNANAGVALGPFTTFNMNGGLVVISSVVPSIDFGFGSVLASQNINLNGGVVVNKDTVASNSFSIGSQGTYTGSGTTIAPIILGGSLTVTNSGTLIPGGPNVGAAAGIMTIQGTYNQTDSGKLLINVDGVTSSELLITGSAQLDGTLQISETTGGEVAPGQMFTVLKTTGSLNGTFSHLEDFHTPYVVPHVQYLSNSVQVFFTPSIFPDPSGIDGGINNPKKGRGGYVNLSRPVFSSINETYMRLAREMGRVRSNFTKPARENTTVSTQYRPPKTATLPIQLVSLEEQESNSLEYLSTYQVPNTRPAIECPVTEQQEAAVVQQQESVLAQQQEEPIIKEKTQRLTESLGTERKANIYVGPKGQIGNVVSDKTTQGYSHWSAGAFVGFDYAFSEVGVGIIGEYERMDANVGKRWGNFTIDSVHTDAYATYAPSQLPEFSINGIIGGGYQWYKIERKVHLVKTHTMKATPNGGEFDTLLGVEYAFRNNVFSKIPERLQIIPLASIQYTYMHIAGYSENGFKPFALKLSHQNINSLRTSLGFRMNYTWSTTNVDVSPEFDFEWQSEFLDKERGIDITPISFPAFSFPIDIPKIGRNTVLTGFDLLVTLYKKHGIEAGYDFEYNSNYHTHFLYLGYNVRF